MEKWWLYYRAGEASDLPIADEQRMLNEMDRNLRRHVFSGKRRTFIRYATAAAVALIAIAVARYFYADPVAENHDTALAQVIDVAPGTSRATLTLADGRTIELSTDHEGIIVEHEGVMYSDGTGISNTKGEAAHVSSLMSISTPRGGQYQILLSDGTQVWLNADSRLTYPGRFTGKYREVQIEGEGYFMVAENSKQSFRINSQGQQIDVLGTEFNIAAYPDEEVTKTTLVSGAVKVSTHDQVLMLQPGQQAIRTASEVHMRHVDVEYITAWKEGVFMFRQTNLKDVLKSLSRWYDVRIDTTAVPDRRFNGRINRAVSLQQVLRMMEKSSNLKFYVNEERRLMVVD